MIFNSLQYALFLPLVVGLFWAAPRWARTPLLLAASYVFYGWWDWRFLGLLLVSTVVDYTIGRRLEAADDEGRRMALLTGALVLLYHQVACAWFLLSALGEHGPATWVGRTGLAAAPVEDQYVRSLYWAVTTMTTVGYGDIVPHSDGEFRVATVVMLVGVAAHALLIGGFASALAGLDAAIRNRY